MDEENLIKGKEEVDDPLDPCGLCEFKMKRKREAAYTCKDCGDRVCRQCVRIDHRPDGYDSDGFPKSHERIHICITCDANNYLEY